MAVTVYFKDEAQLILHRVQAHLLPQVVYQARYNISCAPQGYGGYDEDEEGLYDLPPGWLVKCLLSLSI